MAKTNKKSKNAGLTLVPEAPVAPVAPSATDSEEAKISVMTTTWKEVQAIESSLKDMYSQLLDYDRKLQSKYKLIAATINESETVDTFVKQTDFTSDTLYYCFNPLMSSTALFFIPNKDNSGLIPLHMIYDEAFYNEAGGPGSKVKISINSAYFPDQLKNKSISILDVIIPFSKMIDVIKTPDVKALSDFFNAPPEAKDRIHFKNCLMETLYEITRNEEYKLRITLAD